jgi:hypothetical protein
MKRALAVTAFALSLALPSCNSGFFDSCNAGDMRCHGNTAQMCNAYDSWEDWQNCGSIGETCSTAPSQCGGYSGIACCR